MCTCTIQKQTKGLMIKKTTKKYLKNLILIFFKKNKNTLKNLGTIEL